MIGCHSEVSQVASRVGGGRGESDVSIPCGGESEDVGCVEVSGIGGPGPVGPGSGDAPTHHLGVSCRRDFSLRCLNSRSSAASSPAFFGRSCL